MNALLLLLPLSPIAVQESRPLGAVDAALAARAGEDRFAGVVGVARGGEVLHVAAFGEADLEHGVAHTVDTRFKLHSLAKPLLSAVLLRSVDAGKVGLDDLVGEHLPDWPVGCSEVTVRHLATHASGVPDFAESFLHHWSGTALRTWRELAPGMADLEPAFAPGTGWAYSNAGYVLLAALLESVWAEPFALLLEEQLAEPVGMESTELELEPPSGEEPAIEGLAQGYNGAPGAPEVAVSRTYAIPGAGGIVSDARDLLAFAHALFDGDLLSADSRRALVEVPDGQSVPYALGWVVGKRGDRTVYRHDGGNNGFVTSLEVYPEEGVSIVLLCNRGHVDMGELRDEVAGLTWAALEQDGR